MAQEQFTYLTAMAAVGLAPIMMTTAGHVSSDRLEELPEVADNLSQELSRRREKPASRLLSPSPR